MRQTRLGYEPSWHRGQRDQRGIETMLLPGSGPVEDAKAETLVVAYFSLLAIDAEEFKHYCERIRRIAVRRKEAA